MIDITIVVVAVVAACPPTITAIAALVQSSRAAKQTAEILGQSKAIHAAVNSNLAAVKADLVIANQRISELLMVIDQGKRKR